MIPRSDFRAAAAIQHLTKLLQLLQPTFTDADCRRRINQAIDAIREIDDAGQTESLHRLFLAALTFTPDTDTETALKELDQVMPNPMNWNKMLDAFCAFIKAMLALFHPAKPPPAVAVNIDLRPFTTDTARKTVSPDYFERHARLLADLLEELAASTTMPQVTDPRQLRDTAHNQMIATVEPYLHAWLDFFAAIDAAMDQCANQKLLSNIAQQQEALRAIARGLRDLLPDRTSPLHAPPLEKPPPTAA